MVKLGVQFLLSLPPFYPLEQWPFPTLTHPGSLGYPSIENSLKNTDLINLSWSALLDCFLGQPDPHKGLFPVSGNSDPQKVLPFIDWELLPEVPPTVPTSSPQKYCYIVLPEKSFHKYSLRAIFSFPGKNLFMSSNRFSCDMVTLCWTHSSLSMSFLKLGSWKRPWLQTGSGQGSMQWAIPSLDLDIKRSISAAQNYISFLGSHSAVCL